MSSKLQLPLVLILDLYDFVDDHTYEEKSIFDNSEDSTINEQALELQTELGNYLKKQMPELLKHAQDVEQMTRLRKILKNF